jgi:hypothetical protein
MMEEKVERVKSPAPVGEVCVETVTLCGLWTFSKFSWGHGDAGWHEVDPVTLVMYGESLGRAYKRMDHEHDSPSYRDHNDYEGHVDCLTAFGDLQLILDAALGVLLRTPTTLLACPKAMEKGCKLIDKKSRQWVLVRTEDTNNKLVWKRNVKGLQKEEDNCTGEHRDHLRLYGPMPTHPVFGPWFVGTPHHDVPTEVLGGGLEVGHGVDSWLSSRNQFAGSWIESGEPNDKPGSDPSVRWWAKTSFGLPSCWRTDPDGNPIPLDGDGFVIGVDFDAPPLPTTTTTTATTSTTATTMPPPPPHHWVGQVATTEQRSTGVRPCHNCDPQCTFSSSLDKQATFDFTDSGVVPYSGSYTQQDVVEQQGWTCTGSGGPQVGVRRTETSTSVTFSGTLADYYITPCGGACVGGPFVDYFANSTYGIEGIGVEVPGPICTETTVIDDPCDGTSTSTRTYACFALPAISNSYGWEGGPPQAGGILRPRLEGTALWQTTGSCGCGNPTDTACGETRTITWGLDPRCEVGGLPAPCPYQ